MSQDNLDLLAGVFAGAEALDKEALLAALPQLIPEICDPEIEWVEDPGRADGRIYEEFYDEQNALAALEP